MAGKTAAAILQEMAVKEGVKPVYDCVSQTGPPHQPVFTYQCKLFGRMGEGVAGSKKEAKQKSAQMLLQQISGMEHFYVPRAPAYTGALAVAQQRKELKPWSLLDLKISEDMEESERQLRLERREAAKEALRVAIEEHRASAVQLDCAATALGLRLAWGKFASYDICSAPFTTVELDGTYPTLLHLGHDRESAAANMIRYLKRVLTDPQPQRDPVLEFQEAAAKELAFNQ